MNFDVPPEKINEATPEKEENMPWVQDIAKTKASEMISELNTRIETGENESPEGSEYKVGPSKSGNENEVGIYFFDPTASKEKVENLEENPEKSSE